MAYVSLRTYLNERDVSTGDLKESLIIESFVDTLKTLISKCLVRNKTAVTKLCGDNISFITNQMYKRKNFPYNGGEGIGAVFRTSNGGKIRLSFDKKNFQQLSSLASRDKNLHIDYIDIWLSSESPDNKPDLTVAVPRIIKFDALLPAIFETLKKERKPAVYEVVEDNGKFVLKKSKGKAQEKDPDLYHHDNVEEGVVSDMAKGIGKFAKGIAKFVGKVIKSLAEVVFGEIKNPDKIINTDEKNYKPTAEKDDVSKGVIYIEFMRGREEQQKNISQNKEDQNKDNNEQKNNQNDQNDQNSNTKAIADQRSSNGNEQENRFSSMNDKAKA